MKRYISIALLLCLTLTFFCSCIKQPTLIEEVASADELSARVGFTMSVPSTAKYTTFSIIETTTAEARFTFNSFIFIYRGSKISAGDALHGKGSDFVANTTLELDTRTTLTVSSMEDGSRVATWNYNGTNYSLFAQKAVTDDVFLELCDLIVK